MNNACVIHIYIHIKWVCVCVYDNNNNNPLYGGHPFDAFGNGNGRSHLYVRVTGGDRDRGSGRRRRGGEFDAPAAAAISAAAAAAAAAADCRRYNIVIIPVAVFAFAGQFSQFRPSVFAPATHSFTHRPSRVLLSIIVVYYSRFSFRFPSVNCIACIRCSSHTTFATPKLLSEYF